MKIELIYDADCPNVNAARAELSLALNRLGLSETWKEHCRQDRHAPDFARAFGSPTILVNGQDVAPTRTDGPNACRLYPDEKGAGQGFPPAFVIEGRIKVALKDAKQAL